MACTCFSCGTCMSGTPCGCICVHDTRECFSLKGELGGLDFDFATDLPRWLAVERIGRAINVPIRAVGGVFQSQCSRKVRVTNPLQAIAALSAVEDVAVLVQHGQGLVVGPAPVLLSDKIAADWFAATNGGGCGCGGRPRSRGLFSLTADGAQLGNLLLHACSSLQLDIVVPALGADWSKRPTTEVREVDGYQVVVHLLEARMEDVSIRPDGSLVWHKSQRRGAGPSR